MTGRWPRDAKSSVLVYSGRPTGRMRCPMEGVGRQMRCSISTYLWRVMEGRVRGGGGHDPEEPRLVRRLCREAFRMPARGAGWSSEGQAPGGSAGKVSMWLMMYVVSQWRDRSTACLVRSPHVTSPRVK